MAFYGTQLMGVTIPDRVTDIGEGVFDSCSSLTAITVDARNPAFSSVDGVLFSKDMTTLIAYPGGKKSSSYTIPDSVTSIGDWAFANTPLTSITLPNSVTSIGFGAFQYTPLTSITFPDSLTSIGDDAFCETQLTSVTIPHAATLRDRAFDDGVEIIRR
jgi:hypothetical protein